MRIEYIIIIIVGLIIALAITKSQRKDFKLEANKLIMLLGGKDNVIGYEYNKSRFIVELKDVTKANKEGIQKIVNLVDGDLNDVVARLKATVDVSKKYRNFAGIGNDMDGQVKFIYRTDEIQ